VRVSLDIPGNAGTLAGALEGLVKVNEHLIRVARLPGLYASGVRYKREPPGREVWQNAVQLVHAGIGDCEDLAAYRAADLRVHEGEQAHAIAYRSGSGKWHAVVRRGNGRIEDPSRRLGMGAHSTPAQRRALQRRGRSKIW
jgi:hypothetical protein